MAFALAENSTQDDRGALVGARGAAEMRLRLGCEITYSFPQPTPLIAMVNVHPSRIADLENPDRLITSPAVAVHPYSDMFGNICVRLTAPAGKFVLGTDAVIRDPLIPDQFDLTAPQHAIEDLPPETLNFMLPSRYCEVDLLLNRAAELFGHLPADASRVQAICDYVHEHLTFDYKTALPTRTAQQAHEERIGVCRDFTHLAIAFCRALNIPAMYCSGYISDANQPLPYASQDFCAWMRVFLGGRWHDFDPRNNKVMTGRVLCTIGRDAADVPLIHSFGWGALDDFKVWVDEIGADPAHFQGPATSVAGNPLRR